MAIAKTNWSPGPWHDEPDVAHWIDEETGMTCLLRRGPLGNWCGYVRVPEDHPWHGVGYSSALCGHNGCYEHTMDVDVHGGLTWDGNLDQLPDGVQQGWWLGFDCAHLGDIVPATDFYAPDDRTRYRTLNYAKRECERLAEQIAAVS